VTTNIKSVTSPAKIMVTMAVFLVSIIIFWGVNNRVFENSLTHVNIENDQKFNTSSVLLEMSHPVYFHPFSFLVDGKDLTSSVKYSDNRASLEINDLKDGRHNVKVYSDVNIYSMAPHEVIIYFEVDTKPPDIKILTPTETLLNKASVEITGDSEPECELLFEVNGDTFIADSSATGYFSGKVHLNEGKNDITIKAKDPAGNESTEIISLEADNSPPEIKHFRPENKKEVDTDYITLEAMFTDRGAGFESAYFIVDGKKIPSLSHGEGFITASLINLDEGEYRVTAIAKDKAGGETKQEWTFVVNTSEVFGDKTLRPGAKGEDVKRLQEQLVKLGCLKEKQITGLYDEDTMKAVTMYQQSKNREVSTVLDREGLLAFCNKIRVYLDECRLFLIAPNDEIIKSYDVACGSYGYPTPPGSYYIKDKQMHPTWYPPPSPWAAGAKPIPPGWGNPLGTRWMGLNDHDIGIHGTYDGGSIGYAASHGCIRIYYTEAEELFDLVQVGTPVDIYGARPQGDTTGLKFEEEKEKAAGEENAETEVTEGEESSETDMAEGEENTVAPDEENTETTGTPYMENPDKDVTPYRPRTG